MKHCSQCEKPFTPQRMGQVVCSPRCAIKSVREEQAAKRAEEKTKRDALQTLPQLKKRAQTAFNAFIRARDKGKPCISCGKPLGDTPNSYDCGHYRSVGSAPHMRFVEDNANGQCKHCNRYLAGNHVEYRKGMVERYGERTVELIERDQAVRKYTKEGLIEIARHYTKAAKELNNGN